MSLERDTLVTSRCRSRTDVELSHLGGVNDHLSNPLQPICHIVSLLLAKYKFLACLTLCLYPDPIFAVRRILVVLPQRRSGLAYWSFLVCQFEAEILAAKPNGVKHTGVELQRVSQ